jgi:hypothetical protein
MPVAVEILNVVMVGRNGGISPRRALALGREDRIPAGGGEFHKIYVLGRPVFEYAGGYDPGR